MRVAANAFGLFAEVSAAIHDWFDATRTSRSRSALPVHERPKVNWPETSDVKSTDVHRGPWTEALSATPWSSRSPLAGVVVVVVVDVVVAFDASSVYVPEPDRAQTAIR